MKERLNHQLNLISFYIFKSYFFESKDMIKFRMNTSRFNHLLNKIKPIKTIIESPNSYCETDNSSDSSFLSLDHYLSQSNPFDIKQVIALKDTRTTVMIKISQN